MRRRPGGFELRRRSLRRAVLSGELLGLAGVDRGPRPRQQRVQLMSLGAPGDDAFEHIGEPGHWFDAVELGGLDERHRDCPMTGAAVGTSEECRLSCHRYRPDGALNEIRVHLYAAIVEEHDKTGPVPQCVAHGNGEIGRT